MFFCGCLVCVSEGETEEEGWQERSSTCVCRVRAWGGWGVLGVGWGLVCLQLIGRLFPSFFIIIIPGSVAAAALLTRQRASQPPDACRVGLVVVGGRVAAGT